MKQILILFFFILKHFSSIFLRVNSSFFTISFCDVKKSSVKCWTVCELKIVWSCVYVVDKTRTFPGFSPPLPQHSMQINLCVRVNWMEVRSLTWLNIIGCNVSIHVGQQHRGRNLEGRLCSLFYSWCSKYCQRTLFSLW